MNSRIFRRVVMAIAAFVFMGSLLFASASAATNNTNKSLGLQISPVLININADKGKPYFFKVSVLNVTSANLYITPHINDFKSKDESGTPQVVLDNSSSVTSAKSWISLDTSSTFMLKSKQSKTINATMRVPSDAEPGGHYAVVRFTASGSPLDNGNGVALEASWGTLILARVSGNIKEQLRVAGFFTSNRGNKQTGFFEKGQINFTERIENTGNVHVAPQGKLTITNMFGKTVDVLDVNKDGGNVLPKSIRRFTESSKKANFGRYTASFALAYGSHGQVLMGSLSFWVIPWKTILITLVIIVLVVYLLIKGYKANNKRVVNKALNKNKE